MKPALCLTCFVLGLCPLALAAQSKGPKDAVVIFKDGFYIKGKAVQKKDFVVDPHSGNSIVIPAGGEYLYVDDGVRRINFSLAQVQDVLDVEPETLKDQLVFIFRQPPRVRSVKILPPGLRLDTFPDWDKNWERTITGGNGRGRLNLVQRLCILTPRFAAGYSVGCDWAFAYQTREMEPKALRKLVLDYLQDKTKLKDFERRKEVARFLAQAGLYFDSMKELQSLTEEYPEKKDAVKDLSQKIQQQIADTWAENIEKLYKAGQHENVQAELFGLEKRPDEAKLLSDKHRLAVQDLKTKYETWTADLAQVKELLKDFPKYTSERGRWTQASKAILDEVSIDTLGRLKTFLEVAPQHAKQLKSSQAPTQKTEEVLALAVSGWLQGDNAASTDAKSALQLWRTRQFVLEYLRTEDVQARQNALGSFQRDNDVPIDVVIRIIRMLPPIQPNKEKLNAGPTKMTIEAPGSDGGSYYLQLPPEYNPMRAYPVLLMLHSHRWAPDLNMHDWQYEAARNGFIVAAPLWGGKALQPKYEFTADQHAIVLDTLRDLRRRFNIDSDRVFLFGWEQGATAAFDIGLAHPDQFAGVLPMNGDVKGFPEKYTTNAQYLPFYIIEGDRNAAFAKSTRFVFNKEWIRNHYPSLYVEYKGRSSEWFGTEIPTMMDWMSRKHRFHPLKELGRYHTGGRVGMGEEFKTMRVCDNRFYWLSTDQVLDSHINSYQHWSTATKPATLQASCAVVNESTKAGPRIWTQFNMRTSGVKQVTLWIAPNQVDFSQPVRIRHNGVLLGGDRHLSPSLSTLLEELYTSGDRQRLYVARLAFRL